VTSLAHKDKTAHQLFSW